MEKISNIFRQIGGKMKKVLLISGGMDSLLIHELKKDYIDYYVYIDYGHRFLSQEFENIKNLSINPIILKINNLKDHEGFFFGRNLHFFIKVREHFIDENICVYFGNNADDNYNDNTREYLSRVEKVINDSYPTKTLRIICPLENLNKQEIFKLCKEKEIKYYFCDSGEKEPCLKCHSCKAMIDAGLI